MFKHCIERVELSNGDVVHVRSLTGKESKSVNEAPLVEQAPLFLMFGLCDKNGQSVLSPEQVPDIPDRIAEELIDAIAKASHMTNSSKEEIRKN